MSGTEALIQAVARLRTAGIDDPARDARRLLAHVLGVAPGRSREHRREALELFGQLDALVRRRVGLPLRLIGELGRDDLAARLQDQAPPKRERLASAAFLRRLSAWTHSNGMTGGQRA